jgi:Glutamine synthetase, catalytic domain
MLSRLPSRLLPHLLRRLLSHPLSHLLSRLSSRLSSHLLSRLLSSMLSRLLPHLLPRLLPRLVLRMLSWLLPHLLSRMLSRLPSHLLSRPLLLLLLLLLLPFLNIIPWGTAVLDAVASTLEQMGIELEQYHAESGSGQFEFVTANECALTAVDNLVATREAISGVAASNSLLASFLPKLYRLQAGNGCHVHLSIWKVPWEIGVPMGRGWVAPGGRLGCGRAGGCGF